MTNNFKLSFIASAALIGSAFILFILSNALSTWSTTSNDYVEITYGIWRQCNFIDADNATCLDVSCPSENFKSDFCNKILAARAFLTLACIVSGIFGILSILYCALSGDGTPRKLLLTMKSLTFVSLLMGIIGVALGISATMTIENNTELRLGDAAIIGIVAIGINLIGAIVTVLVKP